MSPSDDRDVAGVTRVAAVRCGNISAAPLMRQALCGLLHHLCVCVSVCVSVYLPTYLSTHAHLTLTAAFSWRCA